MRPTVAGVLLVAAIVACHTYRPARLPLPARSVVRLRFDAPRPLDVALPGRDTLRLANITQIEGRVLASRGDTVDLAVRNFWTRGERATVHSSGDAIARVAPIPGHAAEVRRLSKGRTALAAYLGVTGALGFVLALLTATNHY